MKTRNKKSNPIKALLTILSSLWAITLVAAPTIPNPSFEADTFTVFPGYISGNSLITGWTTTDPAHAGINPGGGSPFADNGVVPNGSQVAFIQNSASSSLGTLISGLNGGETYKVNFRVNARGGNTPNLKVDMGVVNLINTAVTSVGGANPYKYFAFDFTASGPSNFMTLRNDAGGDHTVLVDDFSIAIRNSGWSYAAWNDDATADVDAARNYTHAYSFGSGTATTINGVNFTGVGGGNPSVPGSFSTAGLPNVFNNDGNNVTGGSRQLANDFLYGGAVQSVTIGGLTFGKSYVATIYSVGWEDGTRAATFSVGDDRLTVNQDQFGDNNGIRVSYKFTANGSSMTLTYVPLQGNTFHTYGFSVYELPPPQVVNPSFEADTFTAWPGYVSGNGPITGWSADGGAGLNPVAPFGAGDHPFADNGVIPDGRQVAFIQSDSALRQVVNGFVVGSSYEVRYFENARSGPAPGSEVRIGGVTIVAPHVVSLVGGNNPYHEIVSDAFVATASSMELAFIKSNPQGGDTTLLIDNVAIRPPNTPPSITAQPQDATVGLGDTVTFTVGAAGSAPLTYQWYFDSNPLPAATSATLSFLADFPDVAGNYHVVVANTAGSITSRVAQLIVRDKVTTFFHTGVDDSGVAMPDGSADTHYSLIVNPDSATTVPVVEDSTSFPIVAGPWVANNGGSKWIGPQLNTAGAAGAVGSGGDYVYRTVVDLTGFDPASVVINGLWSTDNEGLDILVNGVSTGQRNTAQFPTFTAFSIATTLLVAGPNNIDFKLNNSAVGYTGLRVDGVSALGTALPPGTAPFIVQQPQSANPSLGSHVTFNVRANGSAPLSYQWFFGADALPGETRPELSFTLDFPDQAGDYSVEVTNPFGSVRSAAATLTVRDAPLILTQPQSQVVAVGDTVTFAVTVDGAAPFNFQWTKNGVPIPGANDAATLTLSSVVLGDGGTYAVRVSNFAGNATSSDATLTVLELIPGLFNTGVDGLGVSLPSGSVDPHWRITLSVDPGFPGPDAVVLNDVGFPIPPWLANDEFSKWIAPQADQSAGNLEGNYVYRTTFDASGFDAATIRVVGEWATDNTGTDIVVNGLSSGQRNDGGFTGWTPFQLQTGFIAAVNTLDFQVNNAPTGVNPTGFRVRNLRALGRALPPNHPPVALADSATTLEGTPVTIDVLANDSDPDGDPIRISASSFPGAGTITINSNQFIYTPNAGFTGGDAFTYSIVDGKGGVASALVSITVRPANLPPTAVISTEQLVNLGPDFEHPVLISCNWWNACLIADGWTSSDPENGDLTYLWFLDPDPVPFAAGPVVTNCLEVGVHTIVLVVTDPGGLSGTDSKTIEVVTAPLAIELLIEEINGGSLKSVIPRKIKRELTATLRVALDFSKDNKLRETQKALDAFEKKVRAQVVPDYPIEATKWIRWSQAVSEGMEKCIKPPRKPKHGGNTKDPNESTMVTVCFQGVSIQVPEDQVQSYVNQGAFVGPCEN